MVERGSGSTYSTYVVRTVPGMISGLDLGVVSLVIESLIVNHDVIRLIFISQCWRPAPHLSTSVVVGLHPAGIVS